MTVYANFIPNPSFEVGTASWSVDGGTLSRTTSNTQVGTASLQIAATTTSTQTKGAKIVVPINPGGPYTLSGYLLYRTSSAGTSSNRGVVVKVYDLLPGEAESARQQIATATYTTIGRWAVRNMSPRASADRLVITLHTGNSFYEPGFYDVTGPFTEYFRSSQYGGIQGAEDAAYAFAGTKYNAVVDSAFMNWGPGHESEYTYFVDYYERTWIPAKDGGTATIRVDALQLEKAATEGVYADGTVAGYTWSGTAHNSPTLGISQTEGHATATSAGTILFGLILPLQAEATPVSVGTLEAFVSGVESQAVASSSGSLDVWPYGPASAAGTATSAGAIIIAALVPLEIAGTAASIGTLDSLIAVPANTSATALSSGTLDIGLPPDTQASATAMSTGTLMAAIAGVMSASGIIVFDGTIEVGQAMPTAAFLDFAIAGIGQNDPRMSITSRNSPGPTGAAGADWTRIHAEFTVPDQLDTSDGTMWKRAAYVVPGIKFTGLPAGSWQEVTQVQLELAQQGGGPSPYTDGASIRTLVYPDRLNQAPASITVIDTSVPSTTDAVEVASPISGDTVPALRVDVVPDVQYQVFAPLQPLKPGSTYTVSLYVMPSSGLADVSFYIRDAFDSTMELAQSTHWTTSAPADDLGDGWCRMAATFTAPISGSAIMHFGWAFTDTPAASESFTVAGMLLETGTAPRSYFYNPGDDPAIRFRLGRTDHSGGVFHYEDAERKLYILNEALRGHIPAGIGTNPPEFNLIPHYDT